MSRRRRVVLALVLIAVVGTALLFGTAPGRRVQFVLGGALVNLGYRFQDHLEEYDFETEGEHTPAEVWTALERHNELAAGVREWFPRSVRHPLVAVVACMDARIDTQELTGDTRRFYYVIRTAGSVLEHKEQEMLELAVESGVKVVVFTTHSDCAAERVAASAEEGPRYPALVEALGRREATIAEFMARPGIAPRIERGELLVKRVAIDTHTRRMGE
ncbi:MAG TPA: carbonic anhydrase [Nannocystaceae bacterium]|nr:carbonic anhydrase [Nannocystaceae bacterium]